MLEGDVESGAVVAVAALEVGAGLDQHVEHLEVAEMGVAAAHQRRLAGVVDRPVDVSTSRNEPTHDLELAFVARLHQHRAVAAIEIDAR